MNVLWVFQSEQTFEFTDLFQKLLACLHDSHQLSTRNPTNYMFLNKFFPACKKFYKKMLWWSSRTQTQAIMCNLNVQCPVTQVHSVASVTSASVTCVEPVQSSIISVCPQCVWWLSYRVQYVRTVITLAADITGHTQQNWHSSNLDDHVTNALIFLILALPSLNAEL